MLDQRNHVTRVLSASAILGTFVCDADPSALAAMPRPPSAIIADIRGSFTGDLAMPSASEFIYSSVFTPQRRWVTAPGQPLLPAHTAPTLPTLHRGEAASTASAPGPADTNSISAHAITRDALNAFSAAQREWEQEDSDTAVDALSEFLQAAAHFTALPRPWLGFNDVGALMLEWRGADRSLLAVFVGDGKCSYSMRGAGAYYGSDIRECEIGPAGLAPLIKAVRALPAA